MDISVLRKFRNTYYIAYQFQVMSADTRSSLIRAALLHNIENVIADFTKNTHTAGDSDSPPKEYEKSITLARDLLLNGTQSPHQNEEFLRCIFSQIQKKGSKKTGNQTDCYYRPGILSLHTIAAANGMDVLFPQKEVPSWPDAERTAYVAKIRDEISNLGKDPDITTLLYLLKKYTTTLPSPLPSIPHYEYTKLLAALALAFHDPKYPDSPFLFIAGDLSGIQDFIYNIANPAEERKKMAKRLRGRSFWLSLFMDAVAAQIVQDLALCEASILWNTGGNFLILAPNTEENVAKIEQIRTSITENLLKKFNGRIFLALDYLVCGPEGIRDFPATRADLALKLDARKRQKFIECDYYDLFWPKGKNDPIISFCPICGSPCTSENRKCAFCYSHESIGQRLARAAYIIQGEGLVFGFSEFGLSRSFDFVDSGCEIPSPKKGQTIYAINETGRFPVINWTSSGFRFIANTVPIFRNEIFSFGEMAQFAKGARKLGYLKADVDDLGKMFSARLMEKNATLPAICTMSSSLEFFFAGFLNTICNDSQFVRYAKDCDGCLKRSNPDSKTIPVTVRMDPEEEGKDAGRKTFWFLENPCPDCPHEKFPILYITYSGGDDLLIIGPYDAIITLAGDIYQRFRKFTGENRDITLSAGIALVNPKFPVSRAVYSANAHLATAKAFPTGKNSPEKDRISVFDESIPWSNGRQEKDFFTVMKMAETLEDCVDNRKVSMGFVHSLLALWKKTYSDLEMYAIPRQITERGRTKRFVPLLKYAIIRNLPRETRVKLEKELVDIFPWIKLSVYWTMMRMRK